MRLTSSFVPLLALLTATASASVLPSHAPAAEEIHTDSAGNLIWADDEPQLASLGRPDFSGYSASINQVESSADHLLQELQGDLAKFLSGVHDKVDSVVDSAKKTTSGWLRQAEVIVDGMKYQRLTHQDYPEYALRLSTSTNSSICDPNVKQYSGYLDISETKHLWFVFFEARHKPEKAPLTMWLNGGPGCSSSTGLLFELGPCTIADEGNSVVNNPYSWTNKANMIFLDQPVNVGYSYSEDQNINNSPAAAEDVYAFLQLFLQKFPEYSEKPFTIAGESYAGRYIPTDAAYIFNKNKELAAKGSHGGAVHINLESLAIGNGLTEPLTQFASTVEYACSPDNEYALFKNDSSTCASLAQKAKTCSSLIESCYKYDNRLTCLPASIYCWSNLYSPLQDTGKNLYDVRKDCDRSKDGNLCYKEMEWMEVYMNKPEVMKAWGAHKGAKFQSCNMQVNQAFLFQGDGVRDSSLSLIPLIEDGVRVLIYNGIADAMCNHYGNEAWVAKLQTSFLEEYTEAKKQDWVLEDGHKAGWIKRAGKGAGSIAYLHIFEAGHMVPHDQPVAALEMWEKWIANEKLA
ncbi:hypothetical protein BCV69DRAFT_283369 [Microstroma glucosiphilum]|uniref:Carboxypeptidase n=1 Tax=Pseudomicrostroma glucosiphilum TaxID=1684307 RepID=A0A316U6N3_9BASI|nr:hypothetical protein BCV69DRAFT_283369 [Pseudomicrostroma glucosiphilum]PWN20484.1 hypothetical protein BCV69DRAFT_283369 [Pseudomicrostroma glucosiphilum]